MIFDMLSGLLGQLLPTNASVGAQTAPATHNDDILFSTDPDQGAEWKMAAGGARDWVPWEQTELDLGGYGNFERVAALRAPGTLSNSYQAQVRTVREAYTPDTASTIKRNQRPQLPTPLVPEGEDPQGIGEPEISTLNKAPEVAPGEPTVEDTRQSNSQFNIRPYVNSTAYRGWEKVHPEMRTRVASMLQDMPSELRKSVLISDTARDWAQQKAAARRHGVSPIRGKPGILAPWGRGKHHGDNVKAIDFYKPSRETLNWMRKHSPKYGLKFPEWGRSSDPWHLELDESVKEIKQNSGPNLSAYSPQKGGDSMEGGYAAARPGPGQDPKNWKTWKVNTLADVASGKAKYVTLAGNPNQFGEEYIIPEIKFYDAGGKSHTLKDVKAVVHDTGSAFKDAPRDRFDVPIDKDATDEVMMKNHGLWRQLGVEFIER